MADKKSGFGCAFLFGLPFLLIGVCALAMMGWNIYDAMRMASWREAGATITSLNLEEHDTEDGSTQKIVATYTYVVDGQTHHGDRVAITTGSDNIGPYWKDLYRSLQDARSKGSAVCYVNPDDPREAVLDRHIRWGLIGFKAIFAVVFGGVGVAVCFGSFFVRRQEKAREALRLAEGDDAVWKVNKLWQNNRIRAEGGGGAWGLLFIAVIWNAISSPVLFFGIPEMLEEKEYVAIAICAIFPIIGVVLIILAVYHLLRWLKHGRPILEPQALPLALGQVVTLRASGTRMLEALGPMTCTLTCGRLVTTGSGKHRRTSESVLWRHAWMIDANDLHHDAGGWSTTLELPLPNNIEPTNDDRRVSWRLELSMPTTGIDFFAKFPLPIVAGAGSLTSAEITATTVNQLDDSNIDAVYRKAGMRRFAGPGHLRLVSPPLRLRGSTIGMMVMGLIFGGFGGSIGWLIGVQKNDIEWMPLGIGGLFALIGFAIFCGGFLAFLRAYHVEIDAHGIVLRKGLFVPRKMTTIPADTIRSIETKESYQANGVSKRYVQAILTDDTKHTLTPTVGDPQMAETLARDIRRVLGR